MTKKKAAKSSNLETHLALMLDGRITFTEFMKATTKEFEALAGSLLRRWKPPASMLPEDVIQELYMGAWIHMWSFDATRGTKLSDYVVFNAMAYAKRAIHKARGAKLSGTADKNPSRMEKPLSSFGPNGEGDLMAETLLAEEPRAEEMILAAEERARMVEEILRVCESQHEENVVLALARTCDEDEASEVIFNDIDMRLYYRMGCEAKARKLVSETASVLLTRLELMAS